MEETEALKGSATILYYSIGDVCQSIFIEAVRAKVRLL